MHFSMLSEYSTNINTPFCNVVAYIKEVYAKLDSHMSQKASLLTLNILATYR